MDILWVIFPLRPSCPWDIGWVRTWLLCSLCSPTSKSERQHAMVTKLLFEVVICNTCEISRILLFTHCFACYELKIWTYTSFECLSQLILNLLILKTSFDCCCFTVLKSYKHLIRYKVQIFDTQFQYVPINWIIDHI